MNRLHSAFLASLCLQNACLAPHEELSEDSTTMSLDTAVIVPLEEVMDKTANECHEALLSLDLFAPQQINRNQSAEPELKVEGESIVLQDAFTTPEDYGDGFLDHLKVYAGFEGGDYFCKGEVDLSLDNTSFTVNLDLMDPACGNPYYVAEQRDLSLYLYYGHGDMCQLLFNKSTDQPSVYLYDFSLNLDRPEASFIERRKT